jgi:hypothetical protein
MQPPRFLLRRDVPEYVFAKFGLEVTAEQLARFAVNGGGPRFRLLAGRPGRAIYAEPDIDRWVGTYLGPLVARVSDHPAHRSAPHKGEAA